MVKANGDVSVRLRDADIGNWLQLDKAAAWDFTGDESTTLAMAVEGYLYNSMRHTAKMEHECGFYPLRVFIPVIGIEGGEQF